MAICKSCGRKYSKWTTPVSAHGVCRECFETELEPEPKATAEEESTRTDQACNSKMPQPPIARVVNKVLLILAIGVAGFLLICVIVFGAFETFKVPPLVALYGVERWAGFVANLVVLFYTFPAFKRTKRHGYLYTAIAALIFMYALIFGLLFPTTHTTLGQREWYYVVKTLSYIAGLGFYARGIMLLTEDV